MKIIEYRFKESGGISRIETLERYMQYGHTIEEIEEKVKSFEHESVKADIRDIPADVYDLIKHFADESTLLYVNDILQPSTVSVPKDTYIYAFSKHVGHDLPTINILKFNHEGIRLPEIHGEQGVLPIAWCKASDLYNMLGFTKRKVNELHRSAKSLAWSWYNTKD